MKKIWFVGIGLALFSVAYVLLFNSANTQYLAGATRVEATIKKSACIGSRRYTGVLIQTPKGIQETCLLRDRSIQGKQDGAVVEIWYNPAYQSSGMLRIIGAAEAARPIESVSITRPIQTALMLFCFIFGLWYFNENRKPRP